MIDVLTRMDRTLGLFLTTNPTLVDMVSTLPPLITVMHHIIMFVGEEQSYNQKQPQWYITGHNYQNVNWQPMREDMKNFSLPEGNTQ